MDPARWAQLDKLLEQVLEEPASDREAAIRRLAAGDEALERELRSLAQLDRDASGFMESPAIEVAAMGLARQRAGGFPRQDEGGFQAQDEGAIPTQDEGEPAARARIGAVVLHYRVIRQLGAGGMGEVFQAEDTRLDRFVALKFLASDFGRDAAAVDRFRREARAASSLNHPNICTIYDIGEQDGHPFHVMEYLEGATLQARIAQAALPLEDVVSYGIQIAGALDAAHGAGIIHRDIKPANIFVTTDARVKILDFGLARLQARDADAATEQGVLVGTPLYMSPEQASGAAVDTRTDLFSFGLVLYEMATGTRATIGLDLARDLPAQLAPIVSRCLERDRERRYQRAADIRADLERLTSVGQLSSPIESRPAWTNRRTWTNRRAWRIAAALIVLAGVGAFAARRWIPRPVSAFAPLHTLVLADFSNTTGDPVFDETLREGVTVQLRQSPFLSVMSDGQVRHTLRLMDRPPDSRLDEATAKEVCQRAGGAAVVDGSIRALGSQYVIGLRATDCGTGAVLHNDQSQAARKEDVLTVLSGMVTRLRTRAGESIAAITQHNTPLAEATTASLDALEAYSAGWRLLSSTDNAAALPFFQRAIDRDPSFAMAYATLGRIYGDLGEAARSRESTEKAYELRQRTTDRERFWIEAAYDTQVTENLLRAESTCELWEKTYPRDIEPHLFLAGVILPVLGKYEQGAGEANQAIALNPDFAIAYYQLASRERARDRLAPAEAALARAAERRLDIPELGFERYDLAFLKHDAAEMGRQADLVARSSEQDEMLIKQASAAAFAGRIKESRDLALRASELALEHDDRERAAEFEASAAVREALVGDVGEARRLAAHALSLSNDRPVEYGAGVVTALAGNVSGARQMADDLARRFPDDLSVRASYLPVLHALVALEQRDPASAIESLNVAVPYDLITPRVMLHAYFGALYPVYVRGLAYLASGDGKAAVIEFQKILDHPGIVAADPIGAIGRLQQARALAMSGQNDAAKLAYRTFLDAWSGADSSVPLLREAKQEYARLR